MLEDVAEKARRGLVDILEPLDVSEATTKATLPALRLHAEECLSRGQLLEGWKVVEQLALEFAETPDVFQLACDLMQKINDAAQARIEGPSRRSGHGGSAASVRSGRRAPTGDGTRPRLR